MSSIVSFFSSFVSTTHADSEKEAPADAEVVVETPEEEPEEPEDVHPALREECKASAKCAALTKHFEHCQEKVQSGQGFKGEDCVEELMMHCVEECAAPKLFAKLR
ncbi:Cytochrome b-c1 complex subunit 6, mitochondrial [Psilocybe cubensis]|uniref:Ubiquinol-cytochrome C reductase hinge domain-containing protein n=2 Tax=Psilocybe cubensis TaxID=181762 RepID=A0A8H8CF65_PSICU|nr:Cytochrome b-c1 complex subunit 6, mitochondrial [Psilocybe cubensis]KAH9477177.1 Cytochrome b-c1 complex subunit 6, mitochondrial [Psilocybe cubensis]